jgi:segregation and condensation protein A
MEVYFTHDHVTPMSDVVTITTLTIRNRINEIKDIMQMHSKVSFSKFIEDNSSRLDIVITFLALLELVKNHAIIAAQENLFTDIAFETTRNLDLEFETEL